MALDAENPESIKKKVLEHGFVIGSGYGELKNSQVRDCKLSDA